MASRNAALLMVEAMHQARVCPLEDLSEKLAISAGSFIRFRCEGDRKGTKNGYAMLFTDCEGGVFGHWSSDLKFTWRRKGPHKPWQPSELRAVSYRRALQEEERQEEQLKTALVADRLIMSAAPADPRHPYLVKKGVPGRGLFQNRNVLFAPMTDVFGKLWNVQRIMPDGTKLFLPGPRRQRIFWSLGLSLGDETAPEPSRIYIGEGVATLLAVHYATDGGPVVAAMDAHSLEPCARAIRIRYPKSLLIICADDDAATAERIGRNPGIEAANAAAAAVGGVVLPPKRRTI